MSPKLTRAQLLAIDAKVDAGFPCPLCRVAIRPSDGSIYLSDTLARCPHCFRTFEIKNTAPSIRMAIESEPRHMNGRTPEPKRWPRE